MEYVNAAKSSTHRVPKRGRKTAKDPTYNPKKRKLTDKEIRRRLTKGHFVLEKVNLAVGDAMDKFKEEGQILEQTVAKLARIKLESEVNIN